MRLQKQLFRHQPDEGIFGDCFRTCVACLLDLAPEDVPHEHRRMEPGEQIGLIDGFLHARGVRRIEIAVQAQDVDGALFMCERWSGGLPYLLSGTSRNGVNHVVIGRGDRIIHDPAIDDSGIIGPCDDGYFWVEWLVRPADAQGEPQ